MRLFGGNEGPKALDCKITGRLPCIVRGELFRNLKRAGVLETEPSRTGNETLFKAILEHRENEQPVLGFIFIYFSKTIQMPALPPLGTTISLPYIKEEDVYWVFHVETIDFIVPYALHFGSDGDVEAGGHFELRGLLKTSFNFNCESIAQLSEYEQRLEKLGWGSADGKCSNDLANLIKSNKELREILPISEEKGGNS